MQDGKYSLVVTILEIFNYDNTGVQHAQSIKCIFMHTQKNGYTLKL